MPSINVTAAYPSSGLAFSQRSGLPSTKVQPLLFTENTRLNILNIQNGLVHVEAWEPVFTSIGSEPARWISSTHNIPFTNLPRILEEQVSAILQQAYSMSAGQSLPLSASLQGQNVQQFQGPSGQSQVHMGLSTQSAPLMLPPSAQNKPRY